jgi:hypothetical protein
MLPRRRISFDQGNNTALSALELPDGYLVSSEGGYYKPGDPVSLRKIYGRTAFGTVQASNKIKGLALCQFDSTADRLIAYYSTIYRIATAGLTGTFADLATGLDSSASLLSVAHARDKWFLCNGYDINKVIKSDVTAQFAITGATNATPIVITSATHGFATGERITIAAVAGNTAANGVFTVTVLTSTTFSLDGSVGNGAYTSGGTAQRGLRDMSMRAPQTAPGVAAGTGTALTLRPTANETPASTLPFTTPANAYDTDAATYTSGTAALVTAFDTAVIFKTFASNTASGRVLTVAWGLAGSQQNPGGGGSNRDHGSGGSTNFGARVSVNIEVATDWNGTTGTFVPLARLLNVSQTNGAVILSQMPVTVNNNLVAVKARLTYHTGQNPVTLRIYDVKVQTGVVTPPTADKILYYATVEVDTTNINGPDVLQGPPSSATRVTLTATTHNLATVTRPTLTNANATEWWIYRTVNGGQTPAGLTRVGRARISDTTWIDTFETYDWDTPGEEPLPLVGINANQGPPLYFARDAAAPAFRHINYFRGSLVGISRTQPRVLSYSFAGREESFPECYVIDSFPMAEHDVLVATATVGDVLLIGAADLMMTLGRLPRVQDGKFVADDVVPLRGQPGLVGQDAICTFSVDGEPRAAWVSRFGVHITNGQTCARISKNMDWDSDLSTAVLSSAILRWDSLIQCLVMTYSSGGGGVNDRQILFHMSPDQADRNGVPKWTGPTRCPGTAMVCGIVSSVFRRYMGHATDGVVYVENNPADGADAAQAYSGTQLPFFPTAGQFYDPSGREFAVTKARLRHRAFGSDSGLISWTMGRDPGAATLNAQKAISLAGTQGTEFAVMRSGEWGTFQIQHTGSGRGGSIQDVDFEVIAQGRTGKIS